MFLEKITKKALTPVNSSENDGFADGALDEAEETDTPLSSASTGGLPLCNLRFVADCKDYTL